MEAHRLAIVCATDAEYEELQHMMAAPWTIDIAGRTFLSGKIDGLECVVNKCGVGKISASATAQILIGKFECSALIFVGVAGSLNNEVDPGDIVVSSSLQHWDVDFSSISESKEKCEIPHTKCVEFNANEDMKKWALEASEDLISKIKSGNSNVLMSDLEKLGIKAPKVHTGIIATGDAFICSFDQKDKVKSCAPAAMCVEMEGVAVAQCCSELKVPFVVVRIISDRADCEGTMDYDMFCKLAASKYTLAIAENLIKHYAKSKI